MQGERSVMGMMLEVLLRFDVESRAPRTILYRIGSVVTNCMLALLIHANCRKVLIYLAMVIRFGAVANAMMITPTGMRLKFSRTRS